MFLDKLMGVMEEGSGEILGMVWEIYSEIKENVLFWEFDQLIE